MIVLSVGSASSSPIVVVFSVALLLFYFSETSLGAPCPINGAFRLFSSLLAIRLYLVILWMQISSCLSMYQW